MGLGFGLRAHRFLTLGGSGVSRAEFWDMFFAGVLGFGFKGFPFGHFLGKFLSRCALS